MQLIAMITFSCAAIASFIGTGFLYLINEKRQKQIEAQYSDIDD